MYIGQVLIAHRCEVLKSLVLLLIALLCQPSAVQSYTGCNFGSLPGTWDRSATLGLKWQFEQQAVTSNCSRMEPLLWSMRQYEHARFLSMTTKEALRDPRSKLIMRYRLQPPTWQPRPTNMYQRSHPAILFLGDHHDRWLVLDACQKVRSMRSGTMQQCPRYPDLSEDADADQRLHRYMYFRVCENGAASFAMRYVPGANPTGPYHKQDLLEGVSSSNASWVVRTSETLSLFSRYFGREPDMVVVHANYWDLMSLRWQGEQLQWLSKGLPEDLIQQWTKNMQAWIDHLRLSLPYDTLIMLRTAPLPKTDARGNPHLKPVGGTLPIAQLNNVIRALASAMHLPLLDGEMHTRHLDPKQCMRDNFNPSNWVNLEWTNMILNVLRHHKPRLFKHIAPTADIEDAAGDRRSLNSNSNT